MNTIKKYSKTNISIWITALGKISPFFGSLVLFIKFVPTNKIDTAATDGETLYFNERFMLSLSKNEQLGVILHEVLHAALQHTQRLKKRDLYTWNIAADIVVNGMIKDVKEVSLPSGAIFDDKLSEYQVEEVYEILLSKNKEHIEKKYRANSCQIGMDILDDKNEDGLRTDYWKEAVTQAKEFSKTFVKQKNYGNQALEFERLFKFFNNQVDWRVLLSSYIVKSPVNYTGYDRRFISNELYIENLDGETLNLYLCIDTSGSISYEELSIFMSELFTIIKIYPNINLSIFYADTHLYGPFKVNNEKDINPPLGGGGTSFIPFCDYLNNQFVNNSVALYFTDGYGMFPSEYSFDHDFIWIITKGGNLSKNIPFGNVIRLI